MAKDDTLYVASCHACNSRNSCSYLQGILNVLPARSPTHLMSTDLTGLRPITVEAYRWIFGYCQPFYKMACGSATFRPDKSDFNQSNWSILAEWGLCLFWSIYRPRTGTVDIYIQTATLSIRLYLQPRTSTSLRDTRTRGACKSHCSRWNRETSPGLGAPVVTISQTYYLRLQNKCSHFYWIHLIFLASWLRTSTSINQLFAPPPSSLFFFKTMWKLYMKIFSNPGTTPPNV